MCYKEQVKKYLEYCEFRKELDWNTLKAYRIDLKQFFEYVQEDMPENADCQPKRPPVPYLAASL